MSDILGTIFGKTSKEKSSSTSTSNSVTGNNAYDTINSALSPTLGFSSAGGSMIGALLGLPGYQTMTPTQVASTAQTPTNTYSGVPQVYTPPATATTPTYGTAPDGTTLGGGVDGTAPIFHNLRDLGRTDLSLPSSVGDNPYRYSYLPAVNTSNVDALTGNGETTAPAPSGGYVPPVSGGGGSGGYSSPTTAGAYNALDSFANSGGLQFLLNKGRQAIESSQAGKGMLQSGATGKALEEYGQGLGSTYLNQYMQQLLDYAKLGTANSAVLSDAGKYSNALVNSSSTGSGSGGKTGLLQSFLGGGGGGGIMSALA